MLISFSFILARLYPPARLLRRILQSALVMCVSLPSVKQLTKKVHSCAGAFLPFATSGGSGIEDSVADLRKTLPNADVKDGLLANISAKIEPWLNDNGMLKK